MTERNIFVYKLCLSLNISDFSFFLCKNCNPPPGPKKSHPPLKIEILSSPSFLQIQLEAQPHPTPTPPSRKGGEHTMINLNFLHGDKHQTILQVDTISFGGHGQIGPNYPKYQVCKVFALKQLKIGQAFLSSCFIGNNLLYMSIKDYCKLLFL